MLIFSVNKEWGRIRRLKSPALREKIFKFSKLKKKLVLFWKMSSWLSQLHHIRFLYLNLIMLWLMMCVKNGSYLILMENRCKMAIKYWFFNMNGSSLHFLKTGNKTYRSYAIILTFFQNGDLTHSYCKIDV
jgi:hypothetical protein